MNRHTRAGMMKVSRENQASNQKFIPLEKLYWGKLSKDKPLIWALTDLSRRLYMYKFVFVTHLAFGSVVCVGVGASTVWRAYSLLGSVMHNMLVGDFHYRNWQTCWAELTLYKAAFMVHVDGECPHSVVYKVSLVRKHIWIFLIKQKRVCMKGFDMTLNKFKYLRSALISHPPFYSTYRLQTHYVNSYPHYTYHPLPSPWQ